MGETVRFSVVGEENLECGRDIKFPGIDFNSVSFKFVRG